MTGRKLGVFVGGKHVFETNGITSGPNVKTDQADIVPPARLSSKVLVFPLPAEPIPAGFKILPLEITRPESSPSVVVVASKPPI